MAHVTWNSPDYSMFWQAAMDQNHEDVEAWDFLTRNSCEFPLTRIWGSGAAPQEDQGLMSRSPYSWTFCVLDRSSGLPSQVFGPKGVLP